MTNDLLAGRRQQVANLRGIVRLVGTQKKAAKITGIIAPVVSRLLNDGYAKKRADDALPQR